MQPVRVIIIALLVSFSGLAQDAKYTASMSSFQAYYNENNGQGIFDMMDRIMQESISLKQINSIVDTYYTNFGKMESFQFTERKDLVEMYHCQFEYGVQRILIAVNSEEKIIGLLFKPDDTPKEAKFDRNSTPLDLPFKGEWFTYWGGTDKRQNYHVAFIPQQGAFDFIVLDKNKNSYTRSGTRNEDYYAFGKPLYAVCDAIVYKVETGVPDNRPSQMNPSQALGNYVVLKTAENEYIYYAHFQNESIKVKEGQAVKRGQYLGNCGNSGNSSEPHLHLHIQDGPNELASIGARCYFESINVNDVLEKDYSPVKGDRISRQEN